jgi:hypothetical protein
MLVAPKAIGAAAVAGSQQQQQQQQPVSPLQQLELQRHKHKQLLQQFQQHQDQQQYQSQQDHQQQQARGVATIVGAAVAAAGMEPAAGTAAGIAAAAALAASAPAAAAAGTSATAAAAGSAAAAGGASDSVPQAPVYTVLSPEAQAAAEAALEALAAETDIQYILTKSAVIADAAAVRTLLHMFCPKLAELIALKPETAGLTHNPAVVLDNPNSWPKEQGFQAPEQLLSLSGLRAACNEAELGRNMMLKLREVTDAAPARPCR